MDKMLQSLNWSAPHQVIEEREENSRCEDLGVRLYSVQQELARLQAVLEDRHESSTKATNEKRRAQEQLENIRNQYSSTAGHTSTQRTQGENSHMHSLAFLT